MALEQTVATSRRALLLASLAGLSAVAAEAVARPAGVFAADPNDVVKGVVNHATNVTTLINDAESGHAFEAIADAIGIIAQAGSDTGIGLSASGTTAIRADGEVALVGTGLLEGIVGFARVAIRGNGTDVGVQGSGDDAGILGTSTVGHALRGEGSSTDHPAILGWSTSALTGIQGYSAPAATEPGTPPAKTGVYGYAAQDGTARGVYGQSTAGRGLEGRAISGFGVLATATTGTALGSYSDTNGWALRTTRGHVGFSTAGLATIAAGANSVTVTPGFDIRSTSAILATLQGDPGGSTVLRYVTKDTVNDRFTIRLSANAAKTTTIAWFVIG